MFYDKIVCDSPFLILDKMGVTIKVSWLHASSEALSIIGEYLKIDFLLLLVLLINFRLGFVTSQPKIPSKQHLLWLTSFWKAGRYNLFDGYWSTWLVPFMHSEFLLLFLFVSGVVDDNFLVRITLTRRYTKHLFMYLWLNNQIYWF